MWPPSPLRTHHPWLTQSHSSHNGLLVSLQTCHTLGFSISYSHFLDALPANTCMVNCLLYFFFNVISLKPALTTHFKITCTPIPTVTIYFTLLYFYVHSAQHSITLFSFFVIFAVYFLSPSLECKLHKDNDPRIIHKCSAQCLG